MSRRKQAKPRAFLKLDEKSEKCENLVEINELNEEFVSDGTESGEEIEDDYIERYDSQNKSPKQPIGKNVSRTEHTKTVVDIDATSNSIQVNQSKETNKENECNILQQIDSPIHTATQLDDNDEYVDDDLHSLESFYSDMYSTHTSSSYSPSISDGTITPNSLHQQHLQLAAIHQYANAHEEHIHDDNQEATPKQLSNQNFKIANKEDEESLVNEKGATTRTNLALVKRHGRQKLHYHHAEHLLRMPEKLNKVVRHTAKLNKLTSDGIKNSGGNVQEGSYQCQFCDKSFPRLGYLKKHEQSHAEHLPFKCEYCARLFKHKRSRDRHTKLHTGDRRYKCPHCEAAFSRSDHLKIHMKTHDNQKPFQCTVCNRGYNTAAALTSHMQNHKKQAALLAAGGNPQAFNYSPRSAGSGSSTSSLQKRRYALTTSAVDNPNQFDNAKRARPCLLKCTYCGRFDFDNLEKLNGHIMSAHEKDQSTTIAPQIDLPMNSLELSCEYCTMKFSNIATMFDHMRSTHIDQMSSPNSYLKHLNRLTCSTSFSPRLSTTQPQRQEQNVDKIKEELEHSRQQRHNDQHVNEEDKPTDLSQNKQRRSPSASIEIMNSPPKAIAEICGKPEVFLCNQCNAGLPDFESFRNHLKMHIVQGIQLVCQHCGLSLREQSEYERHIISHFLITNIEFACTADGCSKTFNKLEDLQSHLTETHIVQMFKCNLCSEVFDSKVAIQVHFSCVHSAESKFIRCSACMETFHAEEEFKIHVKSRHQNILNGSSHLSVNNLQCIFCRAVCNSELEMHFHLAAHARQFRCPSCPETFNVEFLLDRHMQTHHGEIATNDDLILNNKDRYEEHSESAQNKQLKSLYANSLFGKTPLVSLTNQQNNNNSILDYNVAFAAVHLNKGIFNADANNKHFNPMQADTNVIKHPGFMYGLGQRYFDTNRALIDIYAHHHQEKINSATPVAGGNYFISPKQATSHGQSSEAHNRTPVDVIASPVAGFSCGMCDRNDFRTETELHSHRKIVHNLKTGVSLRCAYCADNFKSRSELEHHMKTCHNSTGKHKCLICDEIFPSPAILAEHKLQHSKVGQSGKCSHCSKHLADVSAYKEHLTEHNSECQIPVQCICCRQTLHSEFEIGLHARFHTKSSGMQENVCAMCLEPLLSPLKDMKICDSCCRKHKLSSKYKQHAESYKSVETQQVVENRCNLCKIILPHAHKLQEHLVEHTFAGCEDRGFNCYICSAVFTATNGLLSHMLEHGLNSRPYDCNLCSEKFFFRAELEHHLIDHDSQNKIERENSSLETAVSKANNREQQHDSNETEVKQEFFDKDHEHVHEHAADDDEYIEVEKIPENNQLATKLTANTNNENMDIRLAHSEEKENAAE